MPISTLRAKSIPSTNSRKPCTKCWRDCSPSVTMSMPQSSCSLSARMVASRLAAASSAPASRQGAHNRSGSASHAGFGRLPAIVVANIDRPHGRVRKESKHIANQSPEQPCSRWVCACCLLWLDTGGLREIAIHGDRVADQHVEFGGRHVHRLAAERLELGLHLRLLLGLADLLVELVDDVARG